MPRITASLTHSSKASEASISTVLLERHARGWILDGECRQLSEQTLAARRFLVEKLLWYLRQQEFTECGVPELRSFLAYVSTGHKDEAGRWGNPNGTRQVRPRTVHTYHGNLRTLFRFLVAEEIMTASPAEQIKAPVARADQIQPFTPEQVNALLAAAKKSAHPKRNEAIIYLLLDTGMRASELCGLRVRDVDLVGARRCTVLGKGNKRRTLFLSGTTAKALFVYANEEARDPEDFLFLGDRGSRAGEALTRSGLQQLFERLGKTAHIELARCSPHTFRHTFAVEFLRGGGNTFTLQQLLGHTSLAMTNRYVSLAQADIENQHRQYSPVDRLKGKGR